MAPVRPVQAGDLPRVLEIVNGVIATHHANFHVEPRPLEELAADWDRDHSRYPWFVLERDGGVVGFAKGAAYKPRAAYDATVEVTIYMAPEARGQGLGRQLYAGLLERLAELEFHLALAGIALPNEASLALHEGLGFTRAGVLPEVGRRSGAWRDVALYVLRLS